MLRFLVTNSHQVGKDLGRRDQAVDVVPSGLPFHPVVSLERITFGRVEFSVADSGQRQAHLDEGVPAPRRVPCVELHDPSVNPSYAALGIDAILAHIPSLTPPENRVPEGGASGVVGEDRAGPEGGLLILSRILTPQIHVRTVPGSGPPAPFS